ncbi:MAG: hypothetical protein HY951_11035 [Bacteroidia bacterium]|nr:hypothetical protein [Bacteroidia bacterium]
MKTLAKAEIKNRINNNVPTNELTILMFNKEEYANLVWEESKEFRLNGKMYDVISTVKNRDESITVYCIDDERESLLFELHSKQIDDNSSDNKDSKAKHRVSKVILNYFFQSLNIIIHNTITRCKTENYYNINCLSPNIEVKLPPPKHS